jgi:hypothetical protein
LMLQTTDQGHFFKYLTTLGVAVVAASLTAGGLLLNVQNDLLIEKSRIAKLTPVAQESITKKQHIILLVTEWTPLVIILLSVVGLSLITVGLTGWKRRQNTLDARDQAELNKVLVEVQQMTDQEKDDKVEAEVREIAESDIAAQLDQELSKPEDATPGAQLVIPSVARIAEFVREREADLIAKLPLAFPGDDVRSGVAIRTSSSQIFVDAIVVEKSKRRLYVIELKVYGQAFPTRNIVAALNQVSALSEAAASYFGISTSVPVLIIVAEYLSLIRRQRLHHAAELNGQALRNRPLLLVYSPAEFKNLAPSTLHEDITRPRLRQEAPTTS